MPLKRFNKLVAERVEEYEALSEQISNEENPVTKIRYTRQLGEIEAEIETLERSILDLERSAYTPEKVISEWKEICRKLI